MSVEKWNKWVTRFEGYVYRTWKLKLIGIGLIALGYWDYISKPEAVENCLVLGLVTGIFLILADRKESK